MGCESLVQDRNESPLEERCWFLLLTTTASLPAHCAELSLGGLQRATGETGILSGMEPRGLGTAGLILLREPAAGLEFEFVILWSFGWESTR